MTTKKATKYQVAFSLEIYQSPPLPFKKTVWGIDARCGIYETRIAAIRSQFPEHNTCSDEQMKGHYQRIYQRWKSWKIVKADSLPDLETLRAS